MDYKSTRHSMSHKNMKLCLIAQALIIFIPLVMLQVLFYKSQIGKFRDDIDFTSRALAVKISDNISSDI